jgi:hypothetical protein
MIMKILLTALIFFSLSLGPGISKSGGGEPEQRCATKSENISVVVIHEGQPKTLNSKDIITATKKDSVTIVIPAGTTRIIRELYAHPEYRNKGFIDKTKRDITNFSPGETLFLDFQKETEGAAVRYLLCSDSRGDKPAQPCYPACYQSRVMVRVVK